MIRCTEQEKQAWCCAAVSQEQSSAAWARAVLNRAASVIDDREVVFTTKTDEVRVETLVIRSTAREESTWQRAAGAIGTRRASAPDQGSRGRPWRLGAWARRALNRAAECG